MSSVCGEAPAVMSSGEQLTDFKIGPQTALYSNQNRWLKIRRWGIRDRGNGYKGFFHKFLKSYVYNSFLIYTFYKQDKDLFCIQQPT
jgi:hypothetical protein